MHTVTAKRFLQKVKKLDALIKNKLIEKQQWEEVAYSITAQSGGERVQTTADPQRMASAIEKYIDIEREINESIQKLHDARNEVLAVIEKLPADEYDFLHAVYIQHKSLVDVAAEKHYTYSWATTMHGRALTNVQRIIDRIQVEEC